MNDYSQRLHEVLASYPAKPKEIEEIINRLLRYHELLFTWSQKVNIIGKASKEEVFIDHILDALYATLKLPQSDVFIDIGSGAGLPGIVTSLLRPNAQSILVEPRAKAVTFLTEARRRVPVENITILEMRVEQLASVFKPVTEGERIYLSRAFSPIDEFFEQMDRIIFLGEAIYFLGGENSGIFEDGILEKFGYTVENSVQYYPNQSKKRLFQIVKTKIDS